MAAAVKGYSYAADWAHIVHGLHATLLALGVRAWFEYVRTDANASDKPSREDLSTARYALGEVMGEAITGRLDSEPIGSLGPARRERLARSGCGLDRSIGFSSGGPAPTGVQGLGRRMPALLAA